MPDLINYEKAKFALDPVIFTIRDKKLEVLLSQREKAPYERAFELRGVLLKEGETAEKAIERKLKEVLKTKVYFTQFHAFTAPDRDPRGRIVSLGFLALINSEKIKGDSWYDVAKLPGLAFDHKEIIMTAQNYLRENLKGLVAQQFLPAKFPLNKLQEVYELVLGESFDNRNFRKKMIADGVVVETGEKQTGTKHRPGMLYKFKKLN